MSFSSWVQFTKLSALSMAKAKERFPVNIAGNGDVKCLTSLLLLLMLLGCWHAM
jgi:hypothetical protein